MTSRLHIDWTVCDGRGLCAELLVEDDWGFPAARDGAREPAVPRALERAVRRCRAPELRLLS
jgi:ferredoxin